MSAKPKTIRAKAPAIAVPQDREAASALLGEYGRHANQLTLIDAACKAQTAAAKEAAERLAAPHKAALKTALAALKAFGEARRDELLGQTRAKTADLGTGLIGWRADPPSVKITGEKELLERLTDELAPLLSAITASAPFLRVRIEIDRQAILREPSIADEMPEIAVLTGTESFFVLPAGLELSEVTP
jgi:phage host-nuclease inhibitor protein Gam